MIEAAVVDASVAVKWVVEEKDSASARSLSQATLEAPDLLPIECANILWKKVHIHDLTQRQAGACLALLLSAPVLISPSRELLPAAMDLSIELDHPIYDCVYVALALSRNLPLVTADERLARAARQSRKTAVHILLLSELTA